MLEAWRAWQQEGAGRLGACHLPAGAAAGLPGLIGNTPLVRIRSLSEATGCEVGRRCAHGGLAAAALPALGCTGGAPEHPLEPLAPWRPWRPLAQILAKAEFLNPGGSVKDRVALEIIQEALQSGRLAPGGLVTEGTAGSTGVSLALCAAAFGLRCFVAMPDDAAAEKAALLEALGAEVVRVRPVAITHPEHYVNIARRRAAAEAAAGGSALFADQFESAANFRTHLRTGAEIWAQAGGAVDAFVSGAGTGGTIAGVGAALKQRRPGVRVFLIDPPGSSLYNKVRAVGVGVVWGGRDALDAFSLGAGELGELAELAS